MNPHEHKKLKMNIKGPFQSFLYKVFVVRKVRSLGVDFQDVKSHSPDHVEVVVSGEKAKLWEVLKLSKQPRGFIRFTEVLFQFVD